MLVGSGNIYIVSGNKFVFNNHEKCTVLRAKKICSIIQPELGCENWVYTTVLQKDKSNPPELAYRKTVLCL